MTDRLEEHVDNLTARAQTERDRQRAREAAAAMPDWELQSLVEKPGARDALGNVVFEEYDRMFDARRRTTDAMGSQAADPHLTRQWISPEEMGKAASFQVFEGPTFGEAAPDTLERLLGHCDSQLDLAHELATALRGHLSPILAYDEPAVAPPAATEVFLPPALDQVRHLEQRITALAGDLQDILARVRL